MASPKHITAVKRADGRMVSGIPLGEDFSAEDRVNALFVTRDAKDYVGWGSQTFAKELKLLSASSTPTGTTTFSFIVEARHCNRMGNLHGGCASTIFDACTTSALAPIAAPGHWAFMGVSRTLNVTYIKPVPEGTEVLIESTVVHAGRRLSTVVGTMRRRADGAVLAICEHGKVSVDPEVPKL